MHRRAFCKLLSMLLVSAGAIGCKDSAPKAGNKKVVVVGAGIAGLAAAKQLQSYGYEVLVLEGRDRIGGRIWTSKQWPAMPLDLGATWIHGMENNPLTTLANEIAAPRLTTSYDNASILNRHGQVLNDTEELRLDQLEQRVFELLAAAQEESIDTSVRAALAPLFAEYENDEAALGILNFVLSGRIEQEYAGSAGSLSVHWFDDADEFGQSDVLFSQGFEVITDYLATDLQIELSQQVLEIQSFPTGVTITTSTAVFSADHVIVTLPLGVLKQNNVRFVPELSLEKREAIAKLGMGVLNKCYLQFPYAFWPSDIDWLGYIAERHGEWTEWVSFERTANQPILLGFNAAERGREIENGSDIDIVRSAMDTLRVMFGDAIPEPLDYQLTRWASDPFALGSYSYNALGTTPDMRRALAEPVGKHVYFAGEATSQSYFGTAHGAYLSGLAASKRLINEN